MNNTNNIFNKNEIENKLKDFQEGQDYSVSPTDEPNIKTYNFHNDKLRSVFRNDRVPVRITQEAYNGKDYAYRGHFEEGKDYYYSRQDWQFGENYQGNRGTDVFGNGEFKNFMDGIKWDEHYRENTPNKWTLGWKYRGKGNLNGNNEPKQIEPNFGGWLDIFGGNDIGWSDEQRIKDLEDKISEWKQKLDYLERQPKNEKINWEIERFRKDIKDGENTIKTLKNQKNGNVSRPQHRETCQCGRRFDKAKEYYGVPSLDRCVREVYCSHDCAEKYKSDPHGKVEYLPQTWKGDLDKKVNNHSDLEKENNELRQQLSLVQNQLAQVLEELKKLKNNSVGQDTEKLTQQIVQNEKLIKSGAKVSEAEIREQVQKSEALLKGANVSVAPTQDNKNSNDSLPYLIGGSVILALVGIIGYCLVKKNRGKKVV